MFLGVLKNERSIMKHWRVIEPRNAEWQITLEYIIFLRTSSVGKGCSERNFGVMIYIHVLSFNIFVNIKRNIAC